MKSAGSRWRSVVSAPRRRNAKALSLRAEKAEDELARFLEQSVDLLCVAGLDGYFKRLNPAWTACFGWTTEELAARPLLDFVHPDDREFTTAEIDKLAGGAAAVQFENRYRRLEGSYRWLHWNARLGTERRLIYATVRDVTRQKLLEREILEIADREKERLGRELHDGLCQSLAGIAALSSALSRKLTAETESAASDAAAEIARLLNETIGQARDLAHGLGPVGLNEAGLAGALETLAINVRHLFRVFCTFECDAPFPGIRREAEAHIFRIAQQAVSNAITHGRAERIEIKLSCHCGKGLLSVRDDGVGLPEEAGKRDGAGLYTMDYRAQFVGGSLQVQRELERGTAVICVFPLSRTRGTPESPHHAHNT